MAKLSRKRDLDDVVSSNAAEHLRAFRHDVEKLLPDRVSSIILFGSRARGDAKRDSDYDVAVFVDDLSDRGPVDRILADAAYPHVLAGTGIRPVSVPGAYLKTPSHNLLALQIAVDGIQIL